jgi:hypothetical protein
MISVSDLPSVSDRTAIVDFARTFNGYEHYGSFQACVEQARLKNRKTITDLQNELFFAYRAGNHTGDTETIVTAYRELHPYFLKLLPRHST